MTAASELQHGETQLRRRWQQVLIAAAVGLVYWASFSAISGTNEPWDGQHYWSAAYPGSMVLAVALGFVFRRHAWITGLTLTFTQLPIMVANTGIGPFTFFAVVLLAVLSMPLILAAATTSMRHPSATA